MSCHLYLVCQSHDPELRSDDDVGSHLHHLEFVRQWYEIRESLIDLYNESLIPITDPFFGGSTTWLNRATAFFAQHPNCKIAVQDEYGGYHSIVE